MQGSLPWGSFLDAGTGYNSLRWVSSLDTERWAAVTASAGMARTARKAAAERLRSQDRVLVANWTSPELLYGECFDTVLLDYFIGAIEGFAPYWQEQVLTRLRPHVKGRLYIVGTEPYVLDAPATEEGRIVQAIGRLRDACLLLGNGRPYREYPASWVLRQLGTAGFRVREVRRFPIRYRERFVNSQLEMCLKQLDQLNDPALAQALRDRIEAQRAEALPYARSEQGLACGADYVIAAEPLDPGHHALPLPQHVPVDHPPAPQEAAPSG
ncbi:class I SAM-dependent methyltransferase [Halomonas campisalis]|uniref:class I SAM-dependent methyltransferase n=1 Tax=Billgrantia campisalis TaxID=74661 RepID=UPI001EF089DA|nr:class I SAM-dependent methyltransferase [Halomonas campisalis]MDR5864546.1 class I SAM-dependent methyltransferase [Halomonas campisalis]